MIYFTPQGEKAAETPNQRLIIRADGRVEQACDHGVGHPIGHVRPNGWDAGWMSVHGCDGCCSSALFALETLGRRIP